MGQNRCRHEAIALLMVCSDLNLNAVRRRHGSSLVMTSHTVRASAKTISRPPSLSHR